MNENFFGEVLLGLLLLLAVIFDQREGRIPNKLILVGLFLAGGWNLYAQGLSGLLFSLQGLLAGLALLFIPLLWGEWGLEMLNYWLW